LPAAPASSPPDELRYYILCSSFPNIFSSSLLPHEIAGLAATLEVIRKSDDARVRLHANTRRLRGSFSELGYPIHQGTQQIISLEVGSESDTMVLRDRLEERNVFSSMFCAPATSAKRAMMRMTLNSPADGFGDWTTWKRWRVRSRPS
jgi:CAI-1 autoinducer synthase